MEEKKIQRINELAKMAKEGCLTKELEIERALLRREYIDSFKNNLEATLKTVVIQDEHGNKKPLKKKD